MSQITFKLETPSEMSNFISFLFKTGIQVSIQDPDNFFPLLYETITLGNIHPSWLENKTILSYILTLEERYTDNYILRKFKESIKGSSDFNTELLVPTAHFKNFCGPESLNKDGLMTKKNAYDFILLQIKARGVKEECGWIYMNDYLSELLDDYRSKIDRHELLSLVSGLFEGKKVA